MSNLSPKSPPARAIARVWRSLRREVICFCPQAIARGLLTCASVVAISELSAASRPVDTRSCLNDSIVSISDNASGPRPHISRIALTAEENAAPLDMVVSLRMRNFAELESRIQAGQLVSKAEMEARYLPLQTDFALVAAWLTGQGFTLTLQDANHTNVFVRGTVANTSRALGVTFARVATSDGEFSSAVSAPYLPKELSSAVLGIVGLQPHIRMHTPQRQVTAGTEIGSAATPADMLAYYHTPTNYDGTGQTIAIIMSAAPLTSDLTSFWQAIGSSYSLSKYTLVNVTGGPTTASQSDSVGEATLDTEWATSAAPGANVRLYAIPSLNLSGLFAACTQIMNDGGVQVVSYSAYSHEDDISNSTLQSGTQEAAQMAASGITILACSGDGGSNPNPTSGDNGYSTSNPLTVSYPASDPNVTGVGGTTATFDVNWNVTSESVWSEIGIESTNPMASGGGVSTYFMRPSWQKGSGVPQGTLRCVPDVGAMAAADPLAGGSTGAFVFLNGQDTGFVGTSLSTPIWAGVVAMMDQYRSVLGLPSIGLLNRWVYALNGSNAFNDITRGNNGAYQAGPGYDRCTGIGTPNISRLMLLSAEEITQVGAPANPVSPGSPVTMSVTPQISSSTYQWKLNGVNIPGATGSVLTISSVSSSNSGMYSCVITNDQFGSLSYNLGTLNVTGSTARLINISTRAQVGTGGNILIPGFVIGGDGTETLLIRADGPSLTAFGVSGVLAAPSLILTSQATGATIATNTGWGTGPNADQIASVAAQVGAFAFANGSADCAVIATLQPGGYTVQVSGVGNTTGVALAEVYEVSYTGTARLINIATRAFVGTGGNIIIPGFVIGGTGNEELLVRGDGPSLTAFGVTGALAQPSLTVTAQSNGSSIGSNTSWGTNSNLSQLASISASVGAFTLVSGSADSALVVDLQPGGYTMQISGVNNSTGVALAEVYEVP